MRKIVCVKHGEVRPTPPEDAAQGLFTRYSHGVLRGSAVCDVCNKALNKGDAAVALSCPSGMGRWEDDYFVGL